MTHLCLHIDAVNGIIENLDKDLTLPALLVRQQKILKCLGSESAILSYEYLNIRTREDNIIKFSDISLKNMPKRSKTCQKP